MAITTAMCNSFKQELLKGEHDLDNHTLKIALIKASPSGTYGAATTNYSDVTGNSDEATGAQYDAGGQNLDSPTVTLSGSTAFVDFANASFTSATISAQAALIYNRSSSNTNAAICVLDFGSVKTSTNGTFTIAFPTNDKDSAILRLS